MPTQTSVNAANGPLTPLQLSQNRQSTMQRHFHSPPSQDNQLLLGTQQIKEDIIDALNDLKQKDNLWQLDST